MARFPRVLLISLLALAVAAPASLAQEVASHARIVRISYLEGTVQLNGQPATINTPITEGAVLATAPDALAEVQFEDGSAIRMASETQITFAQLARLSTGEAMTRADLDAGEAEFLIPASSAGRFAVEVHSKNVRFTEPGRFRILSTNSSPLEIAVWKGQVAVRDRESGQEVTIAKNQTFTLNPADPAVYDLEGTVVADDLDQWSQQRDQALSTALSTTYSTPYTPSYPSSYSSSGGVFFYQPTYVYGYNDFWPCGGFAFGAWQPFWLGPGACWNSGFFFNTFFTPFFLTPPVVIVQPPIRPHRPPTIRPPTPPTVAKAGPGAGTTATPGVQTFRFGSGPRPQRVFNDDNFQRSAPRAADIHSDASHQVEPLIAPGQRSAGNASGVSPAHVPAAPPASAAPHSVAPPAGVRPSSPPRSSPPRSFSPPPSMGSRGFASSSMSHSSASHAGGSGRH
jgi:hypothetical protein